MPSRPADGECAACGGALPPPPGGRDRGPPPPAAPRKLPDAYVRSLFGWNEGTSFAGIVGGFGCLFALIGTGLAFVLIPLGCGFIAFGALFGGIGALT